MHSSVAVALVTTKSKKSHHQLLSQWFHVDPSQRVGSREMLKHMYFFGTPPLILVHTDKS